MEIRVEARMTGRQLREQILRQYGSKEALVTAARQRKNVLARQDLVDIELLEEDPRRLDFEMRIEDIMVLENKDLEQLTTERLRILEYLSKRRGRLNVTTLASALRRNKANVSEDLKVLGRFGLVRTTRQGREVLPEPFGTTITIQLGTATT